MLNFPGLISRHQVDPGHLVHVGTAAGQEITSYYEAGFSRITVVEPDPEQVKALRTRFPGVDVEQAVCSAAEARGMTDVEVVRLDAVAPSATVAVIDRLGHERAILSAAPWGSLELLIVGTCTANEPSMYDLVTETVTTRGFIEVDRWTREPGGAHDVAYMKGRL